jgi:putative MATE family efflux protein
MTPPPVLWKAFLAFLGPMLLSNILQASSGTLNNIYYGQMLGFSALAAVAAFFPVLFFFISFLIGLGAGASVLIGQAYGARDLSKIKAISGTVFAATLILALTITVLGWVFLDTILRGLGTPADILEPTRVYSRVMLLGTPFVFVFIMATVITRGVGDTVTPMIALAISTGIGLAVTPALILGWFGLPQAGTASSAYASAFGSLSALAWMCARTIRRKHPLAPDREFLRHLRIDPHLFRLIMRLGVPVGIQMIVVSLAEIVLLMFVNRFGSQAVAACGAVNQIIGYVQFPALSIAITASVFGAQAIGGGRNHQLGAITRTALLMNLIITGSLVLTGYALSRTILGFFLTDPAILALAQDLLHIMLWSLVVFGWAATLNGVMRSSGTVLVPTSLQILAIVAVEVPVAYFVSAAIGVEGVWVAYPASFCSMLLFQTAYYRLSWRKKTFTRLI